MMPSEKYTNIPEQWQYSTLIVIGFRRWKAYSLYPILKQLFQTVHYYPDFQTAYRRHHFTSQTIIAAWGNSSKTQAIAALAQQHQYTFIRIEDGFFRSVGLGSDLIPPSSLVLDNCGIYFDPSQPSALENLLNHHSFNQQDLQRAKYISEQIVQHHLSKYNIDSLEPPTWLQQAQQRQIILVIGQVEDDASILQGTHTVRTNLQLLQTVRNTYPQAFIVYKPHPDVLAKNRQGTLKQAQQIANIIETKSAISILLEHCHEVHTMTSQTGFDALLRHKTVCVYGSPFYAGWGLTQDKGLPFAPHRRQRTLSLEQLIAGTLLHYPIYFDWQQQQLSNCETIIQQLAQQYHHQLNNGQLYKLKNGYFRRFFRKIRVLAAAFFTTWQS